LNYLRIDICDTFSFLRIKSFVDFRVSEVALAKDFAVTFDVGLLDLVLTASNTAITLSCIFLLAKACR
jgi:uncharacterized protein YaiI (UPF0178 family)